MYRRNSSSDVILQIQQRSSKTLPSIRRHSFSEYSRTRDLTVTIDPREEISNDLFAKFKKPLKWSSQRLFQRVQAACCCQSVVNILLLFVRLFFNEKVEKKQFVVDIITGESISEYDVLFLFIYFMQV